MTSAILVAMISWKKVLSIFFPKYLGSERYERMLKINYADHCVDREASVTVGEKGKINMDWLDEVSVFFLRKIGTGG
jgi:hypothetical protein